MSKLVAVDRDGNVVHEGDEIVSFRGTPYTFERATRSRGIGHSGKVLVHNDENPRSREFYDKVFGLEVREA